MTKADRTAARTAPRTRPSQLLAALAATTLAGAAALAQTYVVTYNSTAKTLSIVDTDPAPDVTIISAASGTLYTAPTYANVNDVTYTITDVTPGGVTNGIDLAFAFTNNTNAALPLGKINVPGILHDVNGAGRATNTARDFFLNGPAYTLAGTVGVGYQNENRYPENTFSPVQFLHANGYGVGLSIQYPLVDLSNPMNGYNHRVAIRRSQWGMAPDPIGKVEVNFVLAQQDFDDAETNTQEGYLPANTTRTYTISVRVKAMTHTQANAEYNDSSDGEAVWLSLFEPYRKYFLNRYQGIQYVADRRPVAGLVAADVASCSHSNHGFVPPPGSSSSGDAVNSSTGFDGWATYIGQYQSTDNWDRFMMWAPSGTYPPASCQCPTYTCTTGNAAANWPNQFTSHWATLEASPNNWDLDVEQLQAFSSGYDQDNPVSGTSFGLWWGWSVQLAPSWPCTQGSLTNLVPYNSSGTYLPSDSGVLQALAELGRAVGTSTGEAGANCVGLDSINAMPTWVAYHWVSRLRSTYPGVRFVGEVMPCDILATQIPIYMPYSGVHTPTRKTAHYLAHYLLNEPEIWAQIHPFDIMAENPPNPPSDSAAIQYMADAAEMGYVSLYYILDNLTMPTDNSCDAATIRGSLLPCAAQNDWYLSGFASEATVDPDSITPGTPYVIRAHVTNPGSAIGVWKHSVNGSSYTTLTDSTNVRSGCNTATLKLLDGPTSAQGFYKFVMADACNSGALTIEPAHPFYLRLEDIPCPNTDFDGDSEAGTAADIEAFFQCMGGNCCPTCQDSDFNDDSDYGTDQDIEAFFACLTGDCC